jgi:hypothetical protein
VESVGCVGVFLKGKMAMIEEEEEEDIWCRSK